MKWRRTAARLVLVGAFLAALPLHTGNLRRLGQDVADFPIAASTRDTYGFLESDAYEKEMDRIRAAIPLDGEYVLVASTDEERVKWLRYELAPRVGWVAGSRDGIRWGFPHQVAPPSLPRWAVLAPDRGEAPRLVPTSDLFAHGLPPSRRDEDPELTCWLDAPAKDAVVRGRFAVSGWCQEKGGRPCAAVRLFVDGEAVVAPVTRTPRPDVAAAIAEMGDCSRAGWSVEPAPPAPGEHEIFAILVAQSGKWRQVGPWRFRWIP